MSYTEFVSFLKNRYESFKPIEKLKKRLRDRLNDISGSKKAMWRTFRNLDLNGNGYIDKVEFKDGLKDLGFNSKQKSQSPYYYFNVKYKKFPCSLCNTSYFTYECCKKQFHEATKKHKMNVLKNKKL